MAPPNVVHLHRFFHQRRHRGPITVKHMQQRLFSLLTVLLLAFTLKASAQTGLYASFTGVQPGNNAGWLYGPTVGLYHDRHHLVPLHLGIDLRGSALYGSNATGSSKDSLIDGLAGFRLSVVPHILPFKVYGEALGGIAVLDIGTTHLTRFQYQGNGGLEYTFFPRLDWRVAELSYSGFVGTTNGYDHPVGLSTGLVLRLP